MAVIADMRKVAVEEGYIDENADAKVCQDIVLKALAESTLSRNVTIKGGVAMRGLLLKPPTFALLLTVLPVHK